MSLRTVEATEPHVPARARRSTHSVRLCRPTGGYPSGAFLVARTGRSERSHEGHVSSRIVYGDAEVVKSTASGVGKEQAPTLTCVLQYTLGDEAQHLQSSR